MYQQITVVGNLGREPEMRYMPDGTAVTNLSIATNRRWNDRDGKPQEQTTWFRVAVWGKQAEACNQYLEKGRQVLIVGTLQPDPETGGPRVFMRQDGTSGASYEIRAISVQFLGGRDGAAPKSNGNHNGPTPAAAQEEQDIPF